MVDGAHDDEIWWSGQGRTCLYAKYAIAYQNFPFQDAMSQDIITKEDDGKAIKAQNIVWDALG